MRAAPSSTMQQPPPLHNPHTGLGVDRMEWKLTASDGNTYWSPDPPQLDSATITVYTIVYDPDEPEPPKGIGPYRYHPCLIRVDHVVSVLSTEDSVRMKYEPDNEEDTES